MSDEGQKGKGNLEATTSKVKAEEAAESKAPRADEPQEIVASLSAAPRLPPSEPSIAGPSTAPAYDHSAPPAYAAAGDTVAPTVSSPFNFPPDSALPPYTPPVTGSNNGPPIAIPQLKPEKGSPFVNAYAPSLLSHGITESAWCSFVDTMSAFLTAKISDRAVSHAGDMAQQIAKQPTRFGKNIFKHTKSVGKDIQSSAKKGDPIGVAVGVLGGTITIPLFTALGIVETVTSLPGIAISTLVKKPKTPAQRATAYATVANKEWLHARGLHAQMFDSNELAQMLNMPVVDFLNLAKQHEDTRTEGQLQALQNHIAPLVVIEEKAAMELETHTIWLVVAEIVCQEEDVTK